MKKNTIGFVLFILVFSGFILFFFVCVPTHIELSLENSIYYTLTSKQRFWECISCFFKSNKVLCSYYNKFAYESMYVNYIAFAILSNIINMYYGFKMYRKKWWFYLILLLSIIITVILIDCDMLYSANTSA